MRSKPISNRSLVVSSRFWLVQVAYLVVSSLFLAAFLWLPANQHWLAHTIRRFYDQRQRLAKYPDVPTRQRQGYGNAYVYTSLIRQHSKPTDYFLIPPQRYLIRNAHRQGIQDGYAWLYPSVLFYHLGNSVHLVELTDADSLVRRASFTFWGTNNQLSLLKLTDQNRTAVLARFKQYDPRFFAYTPKQAQTYYKTAP